MKWRSLSFADILILTVLKGTLAAAPEGAPVLMYQFKLVLVSFISPRTEIYEL
jgi:hypothetical protein